MKGWAIPAATDIAFAPGVLLFLRSVVAFYVSPVFAFANAGINFSGVDTEQLFHSVPPGIAPGQFFDERPGIISDSVASGLAGYLLLRFNLPATRDP